ncbi:MAG: hypothetical protein JXR70_01230 [Spirochaetales bacterium]|nr:hypothetical protein [Spirochaetales bacterium]
MAETKVYTSYLQIGKLSIALEFSDREYADSFRWYFQDDGSITEADFTFFVDIVFHDVDFTIPSSLFRDKSLEENRIIFGDKAIILEMDWANRRGRMQVEKYISHAPNTRVYEQLFYQFFYDLARLKKYDACLVHSSGVIKNQKGYLFLGPSEAGKSTAAELSREYTIVNDEICLLEFQDDHIILRGTPFNGFYRDKNKGEAPLKALFLLNKAPEHRIEPVSLGKASTTIMCEIVPPLGVGELLEPAVHHSMLDLSFKIIQKTRVFNLYFQKNSGFWEQIDKL